MSLKKVYSLTEAEDDVSDGGPRPTRIPEDRPGTS